MEEHDEAHLVRRGQSPPSNTPLNDNLRGNATDRMTTDNDGGSPPRSRRRRRRRRRRRAGANKTAKKEFKDAYAQATAATPMLSSSLTETTVTETPTAIDGRREEDVHERRSRGLLDPKQRDHRQKPSRTSGHRGRPSPANGQPVQSTGPSTAAENSPRTSAFRNHSIQDWELFDGSEGEPPALLRGMDDFDTKWHGSVRSRLLALAALVSFILLVVLLLFVAVYYRNIKKRPQSLRHFCTEDVCHGATSYLTSFVNKSIDACSDFYQRVCYRWISGKEGVGFVDGAVVAYYESIAKDVLASNATKNDRIGTHVFRGVFKSCFRFVRSEHSVVESVAKLKERLRNNLFHSRLSWKGAMVLVLELAFQRGIFTVLKVGWEQSSRRTSLHLSLVKPLRDRLGPSADVDVYTRFVDELLPTEDLLNAVIKLDERVTGVARAASDVREIHPWVTVSERLSAGLTSDFWTTALNVHLPQGKKLTRNGIVFITGLEGLVDVLSELMAAPRDAASAYLNLIVFAEVLQYDYFRRRPDKGTDLFNICLRATQKVLTQTWPYVIAVISGHQYRVHYLQDLFDQIQTGTLDEVQTSNWMDATTHLAVKNRLGNSTFYTFSEADAPPDSIDYRNLVVEGDDFISDYLAALAYDAGVVARSTPTTSRSAFLSDLQLSGRVYFDERDSTLIIPSIYMAMPLFYSTHGEQFHNFATVGVKMAAPLAESVSGTRNAVRLQPRQSLVSLASATECYRNQFESAFIRSHLPDYLGNSVFVWTVSVRAAYGMLKKYCQKNLSPGEMRVYWKRIQQLFFERYCLLSCGAEEDLSSPLPTCALPLQSMPEFARAYDCPDGSRMNPVPKCEPL